MSTPFVAILMGSDSDLPIMQATCDVLKKLDIAYEVRITSAHRTPEDAKKYVVDADKRGCLVFVAGAGMAAHLAGAVAANTVKPVIGVPIDAGSMGGIDALLSTAQMPGGIPVATVAIGKAGAKNAGYLAAQIIGVTDPDIRNNLIQERAENAQAIRDKNDNINI
ncbi:MAG: 5-(carboxyamino)imidazole ribonucleotide mutase [Pseudomonadales bacterium]|nr:5-(carboxyamino)imidazole ribonucleotide mutase [Pseudomonadales bacterium]